MGRSALIPRIVETRAISTHDPVLARASANDAVGENALKLSLSERTAFDWGDNSHRTAGKKDKPL